MLLAFADEARVKLAAMQRCPIWVIRYRGDPAASPAMSAMTPIAGQIPHLSETTLSAMTGHCLTQACAAVTRRRPAGTRRRLLQAKLPGPLGREIARKRR